MARKAERHGRKALDVPAEKAADLLALDDAFRDLARLDERQSRIVVLRSFCGLTIEGVAKVEKISRAQVYRDWNVARLALVARRAQPALRAAESASSARAAALGRRPFAVTSTGAGRPATRLSSAISRESIHLSREPIRGSAVRTCHRPSAGTDLCLRHHDVVSRQAPDRLRCRIGPAFSSVTIERMNLETCETGWQPVSVLDIVPPTPVTRIEHEETESIKNRKSPPCRSETAVSTTPTPSG